MDFHADADHARVGVPGIERALVEHVDRRLAGPREGGARRTAFSLRSDCRRYFDPGFAAGPGPLANRAHDGRPARSGHSFRRAPPPRRQIARRGGRSLPRVENDRRRTFERNPGASAHPCRRQALGQRRDPLSAGWPGRPEGIFLRSSAAALVVRLRLVLRALLPVHGEDAGISRPFAGRAGARPLGARHPGRRAAGDRRPRPHRSGQRGLRRDSRKIARQAPGPRGVAPALGPRERKRTFPPRCPGPSPSARRRPRAI